MTAPTITYGHGYLTDCDDNTGWSETVSGILAADASLTVDHGDIFNITAKLDGAGDENVQYEKNITNISSNTYPYFLVRYKTSASSNSLGARVKLVFTSGTQWILGETTPQFSTTWKVVTGTITTGKTIDKIQVWADDYPDSANSGTPSVYFDFILLCKYIWTLPDFKVLRPAFEKKIAQIPIPERDGDVIQDLGLKSPQIILQGDMQHGESWGTPYGEYMYYIMRDSDPWQWITSDMINCKAKPTYFGPSQEASSGQQRLWELRLLMYSLSSLGESTWDGKQWFGMET